MVHDGAIVVPASAVAQDGSDKFVQILQKKQTVKQIVQTGIESNDGMVEIVSGLDEGQKNRSGHQITNRGIILYRNDNEKRFIKPNKMICPRRF